MTEMPKSHLKAKTLLSRLGQFLRVMPGVDLFFEDAIEIVRKLPAQKQLVAFETQVERGSVIVDSVILKPRTTPARRAADVDIVIVAEGGREIPEDHLVNSRAGSHEDFTGVLLSRDDDFVFVEMGLGGDNPGVVIPLPAPLPLHMQAKLDIWSDQEAEQWLRAREIKGMFGVVSVREIDGIQSIDQIGWLVPASDEENSLAVEISASARLRVAV